MMKISVIGAGTMGAGIAQIASTNGHNVCVYDQSERATKNAEKKILKKYQKNWQKRLTLLAKDV